jgi:hypothetical protein
MRLDLSGCDPSRVDPTSLILSVSSHVEQGNRAKPVGPHLIR